MARPFVMAHISDLHVATFGDTFHDLRRVVRRSKQPRSVSGEVLWSEAAWRVVATTRGATKLLDPAGYEHAIPPSGRMHHGDAVARGAARARALAEVMAAQLARRLPDAATLSTRLGSQPGNTNLRFISLAADLPRDLDAVALTGDITDDGEGYELVEAALEPWIARGRLFAIPGNHDLYRFPLPSSARPTPTHASKRAGWEAFATRVGLTPTDAGIWTCTLPEAATTLVGLNSCARRQPGPYRQNGAIGPVQLEALRRVAARAEWREARHRVILMHHHLVRLGTSITRTTREFGMRLDDAEAVARTFNELGVTLVLHGHRHISETRRPVGCRFDVVSAASSTLGCSSGDGASYWRIELGERAHFDRVPIAGG
jgi:3',5'-cyclic AMP phosphodiesterase CpdA